jgi:hypothetical protein
VALAASDHQFSQNLIQAEDRVIWLDLDEDLLTQKLSRFFANYVALSVDSSVVALKMVWHDLEIIVHTISTSYSVPTEPTVFKTLIHFLFLARNQSVRALHHPDDRSTSVRTWSLTNMAYIPWQVHRPQFLFEQKLLSKLRRKSMLLQESEVLVCVDNIRVRQSFKAGS